MSTSVPRGPRRAGLRGIALRFVALRSVAPRSFALRLVARRLVARRLVALRLVALRLVAVASAALACRAGAFPATVRRDVHVPAVPPPREGRGTVVGALADSASGYPVWGAAVYFTRDTVVGTGRATRRRELPADTTRRDGGFALRDVPAGRYTLATDDLDHVPMRTIVIVHAGQVDTVVLRPRRIGGP